MGRSRIVDRSGTGGRRVLLLSVMLLVACSPASPPSATSPTATWRADASRGNTLALPCSPAATGYEEVPDSYTVFGHAVALPTAIAEDDVVELSGPFDSTGGAFDRWAKAGLLVRLGQPYEVIVDMPADQAAIGWGSAARPARRVVAERCDGGTGWIAWPGGFWVEVPRCVTLTVSTPGSTERAAVGVGAPCPPADPRHERGPIRAAGARS